VTPSGLVRAAARRVQARAHRGDAVLCPICGGHFDRFKDDRNRPNALCWRCGSHERHRAQWLLLERRTELLAGARSMLHFAPEWALQRRLEEIKGLRYVTADLAQPGVDLALDVTAIELPDASFDAILCSHVLEHVDDDRAAMAELRRITAPGGWCAVMVPLDLGRERTYEDPSITAPDDRKRAFWQHDHVRLYAADIGERLRDAGFGSASSASARGRSSAPRRSRAAASLRPTTSGSVGHRDEKGLDMRHLSSPSLRSAGPGQASGTAPRPERRRLGDR
jgi:SAM-dependent methyltransferase